MSSTDHSIYTSTSKSQPHSSNGLDEHLGLNNHYLPSATTESPYISSPNYSQTFSNPTSPHNTNSTPGESVPEDANYQFSEFGNPDDEFLGVNFDVGVQRVYSIPATQLSGEDYQSTLFEQPLRGLNRPAFPLSRKYTDTLSAPRPGIAVDSATDKSHSAQDKYNSQDQTFEYHPINPLSHLDPTLASSTPDYSVRNEGAVPSAASTMSGPSIDPLVSTAWDNQEVHFEPNAFRHSGNHYDGAGSSGYFTSAFPTLSGELAPDEFGPQGDDQIWGSSERPRRTRLDPESRKALAGAEIPSLNEQNVARQVDAKNDEIQEWRTRADSGSKIKVEVTDEEDQSIQPVDDAASIRENKLVGDQVYFNIKNAAPTEADSRLMQQPRQWFDAPAFPYITDTKIQPPTANEAIRKWEASADTFSLASRVATWGTRRRSEPSLSEMDAILDGSFLKKLSISKPKETERNRSNSILDQGLVRLASIVRNKKDRKRSRSPENRTSSRPEMRPSSGSRKNVPSLNTTPATLGSAHKPGGPAGSARTSPKSPTHLSFARSVMQRARSRSELSNTEKMGQSGIVDLWRGQGGPPVPSLTTPPLDIYAPQQQADVYDQDEDDDEDDEQADENVDIKSEVLSEPIERSYDGFKAHVRRLNPAMDLDNNWLVSRIGRQQEARYKNLLEFRINHLRAVLAHSCQNRHLCKARSPLLDVKGFGLQPERPNTDLQLVTDFDDDSMPEGGLTAETFPPGVPMPPIRTLPAEFECQLCFKAKKFQKPSDWTKHVHEDLQPFTCTFQKCKEPKSFKRKADWVRHENERHRRLEWWKCEVNDCGHMCYRKDNFLQHLVREHKYLEPAQKTKAAIKKSGSADPAWEMLERCHHDTPYKPQNEPCKFCGRAFNSWKKLMVHHAKHMEQITLPVLRLVESATVDQNTVISPIDQNPTPVTPISGQKLEAGSPFNMDSIPLRVPQMSSRFNSPSFGIPATSPAMFNNMPGQMPQDMAYTQPSIYANPVTTQPMAQAQNFNFLDPNGVASMTQANAFMTSGHAFSSGLPEHGFVGTAQPTGYQLHNNYTSDAPTSPAYQVPFPAHMDDNPFGFEPMAPVAGANFQQPVPRSRPQGGAPMYGYPQHNVPHSGPYYGNHPQ